MTKEGHRVPLFAPIIDIKFAFPRHKKNKEPSWMNQEDANVFVPVYLWNCPQLWEGSEWKQYKELEWMTILGKGRPKYEYNA